MCYINDLYNRFMCLFREILITNPEADKYFLMDSWHFEMSVSKSFNLKRFNCWKSANLTSTDAVQTETLIAIWSNENVPFEFYLHCLTCLDSSWRIVSVSRDDPMMMAPIHSHSLNYYFHPKYHRPSQHLLQMKLIRSFDTSTFLLKKCKIAYRLMSQRLNPRDYSKWLVYRAVRRLFRG